MPLAEQSERFWQDLAHREYAFNSRQQLAKAVRAATLRQWRAWFRRHLLQHPAALAVASHGASGQTPPGAEIPSREAFQSARRRYGRE